MITDIDVLVVGGGPAGLAAAIELRRLGVDRVVVAEREPELGGIARHSAHTGYGLRDFHRVTTGPKYAARYARLAAEAGADLRISTTVTDLEAGTDPPHEPIAATLHSADGAIHLRTRAVLLATGVRERPRSARLIPGDRPAGVYTTGALQQLVASGRFSGTRAVVVGAEHVSFSAVLTLAYASCATVALVTELDRHQTYAPLAWATTGIRRIPIVTGRRVAELVGDDRGRLEYVVLDDGQRVECDSIVFTGEWIAEHELVRRSGFEVTGACRSPRADPGLRLDRPGWFAAGNVLHGAETADVCALDGRHVAHSIRQWLAGARPGPTARLNVDSPIGWISPAMVRPGEHPPRRRFLLRLTSPAHRVRITQGGRPLWTGRIRGTPLPNRACWIPSEWVDRLDGSARPVDVVAIA